MTVEGMKLQSLWYFIGGLPQFQQMTRPFPGIPESVKPNLDHMIIQFGHNIKVKLSLDSIVR